MEWNLNFRTMIPIEIEFLRVGINATTDYRIVFHRIPRHFRHIPDLMPVVTFTKFG